MPEQPTPPTCVTCGRLRAGYIDGEPYCWMHSTGSGLALDAPPPAAAPSPSTVDEARQRVIDANPIWEDVDTALDALVAAVRSEEQQAGVTRGTEPEAATTLHDDHTLDAAQLAYLEWRVAQGYGNRAASWHAGELAFIAGWRAALASALARAADAEMFLKRVEDDYAAHLAYERTRAEQAEARVQGLRDALERSIDNTQRAIDADDDVWVRTTADGSATLDMIFDEQEDLRAVLAAAPAPRAHEENT